MCGFMMHLERHCRQVVPAVPLARLDERGEILAAPASEPIAHQSLTVRLFRYKKTTFEYTCTYVCVCVCVCIYIYIYIYVCVYVCVCMYIYISIYLSIYIYR